MEQARQGPPPSSRGCGLRAASPARTRLKAASPQSAVSRKKLTRSARKLKVSRGVRGTWGAMALRLCASALKVSRGGRGGIRSSCPGALAKGTSALRRDFAFNTKGNFADIARAHGRGAHPPLRLTDYGRLPSPLFLPLRGIRGGPIWSIASRRTSSTSRAAKARGREATGQVMPRSRENGTRASK